MKVTDLYDEIGQIIFDQCPAGYIAAWARVEMLDDVWTGSIFYKKNNKRYGYINKNINGLFLKFKELREEYRIMPGGPWASATFFLSSDGQMKLDLGYEDVSDLGQASVRRNVWIKKYLGDDSLIDWEG